MSSFDDLLGQYEPPGEVEIFLPGKIGEKGGNAVNTAPPVTSGGAGKPSDSQNPGTGPEPSPQLPEGSDPDEPDDAEDPDNDEADEEQPVDADALEEIPDDVAQSGGEPAEAPAAPPAEDAPLAIPRKGGGLTFEGPSVNLKYFPRVLIEEMRAILRPRLGEDFSRDLSQFSLVTAFVVAAMGSDLATDEYTAAAARVFREADPRTDAIDKRTAALLKQQAKSDATLKKILDRLGDVVDATGVLEMGQAYALAERTAQLDTTGALPENIDVTQKRAVASRDNIRRRVADLRRDEKIKAGRPIR